MSHLIDKNTVIKSFIQIFILKERRERSVIELLDSKKRGRFINRLNHGIEDLFDMRWTSKVLKEPDSREEIMRLMKIKGTDLCYIISHYDEFDDQILEFDFAFEKLDSRGLASIIINLKSDSFFAVGEQVQGSAPKYVGRR